MEFYFSAEQSCDAFMILLFSYNWKEIGTSDLLFKKSVVSE